MKLKKALILSKASLHNGPRYIREFDMLKYEYDLYAIGITPPNNSYVHYIDFYKEIRTNIFDKLIDRIRLFFGLKNSNRLSSFVKNKLKERINSIAPDVLIIHTPLYIPFVVDNFENRKFKIVFNAHEYHPLEFENDKEWVSLFGKFYDSIYRNYLKKVDLIINVCDGIAQKCMTEYGFASIVIPNACKYYDIAPTLNHNFPVRIIHHGACIKYRGIEEMIKAVASLGENYNLDLMLTKTDEQYYNEISNLVMNMSNVKLISPVNFSEIVPFINKYDVGLFLLPKLNFNYEYALPNKLFEFIQAKLCIITSPSIEMKKIVEEYNLGEVTASFSYESLQMTLKKLDFNKINSCKENCAYYAKKLSIDSYGTILIDNI